MKMVKVIVLKQFATSDAYGVVKGQKGDKLVINETLAVSLARAGYVRKERKKING